MHEPARLAIVTSVSASSAEGRLWYTNVSPRSGVLCAIDIAINPATQAKVDSLPVCDVIEPFAEVMMKFMFADGDLSDACKGGCRLGVKDAPDSPE